MGDAGHPRPRPHQHHLRGAAPRDIKRLVAYTSISHFGFIILGIFAMTSQGQSGATLYMVNHGISTAALMLVAGFLISRRGSRLIADYGGAESRRCSRAPS